MSHTRTVHLLSPLAALLLAALIFAGPASAAYEQVGCFAGTLTGLKNSCKPIAEEKFGEEVQLGGVGGMTVNPTGVGGVPKGTVYAATQGLGSENRVSMFVPAPDGGLKFELSWTLHPPVGVDPRCGPAVGTNCKPYVAGGPGNVDVEVNPANGNVYVFDGSAGAPPPGKDFILVYKPDGSEVVTSFGEAPPSSSSTASTPENVHGGDERNGLTIDDSGTVFLFDNNVAFGFYHRIMVFKPQAPGKYDSYVYAGEIMPASGPTTNTSFPTLDDAGNIYAASDGEVRMYSPQVPSPFPAPAATPVCSYKFSKGGIKALAVDPHVGDVFFVSYKPPKRVRRLGPCDPETGKFTDIEPEPEAFTIAPERDELWAIAFDPERQIDPSRLPGVLYGGAPSYVSNNGVGEGEKGQSSLGYIFTHTQEAPPEVLAESVAHVTSTGAVLRATIDPHGFNTDYRFQYLTEAAYEANPPEDPFAGAVEAPLGGAVIPAQQGGKNVSESIGGLQPDTAYLYRVVAVSHCAPDNPEKECQDIGETKPLKTYAVQQRGLPDNRAWELVSPADKNGGQVLPVSWQIDSCSYEGGSCKPGDGYVHFPVQSALSGDAVAYEGSPFGENEGGERENQYVSRRDPESGWSTQNPTPQLLLHNEGSSYAALDTGLTQAIVSQEAPALSPLAPDGLNLYTQPLASPLSLAPLLSEAAPNRSADTFVMRYAGGSADLGRVFFEANDTLTDEVPGIAPAPEDGGTTKFNLYEWERASGELRLVNVLPGNAASEAGASFGNAGAHAISADGSRAFFSDQAGQLYRREDADTTLSVPGSGPSAKFLAASTDGTRVLLTNGRLYDFTTEATTDLTAGADGFAGLVGQSDDLEQVYFVDTEILTGESENDQGDKALAGDPNLYAWHEGATSFVAPLSPDDMPEGNPVLHSATWKAIPALRTAKASPSGRFVAFTSGAPLTGYDNTGPCKVVASTSPPTIGPGPCRQVFIYDSASSELRCASCNPSGAAPLNRSTLPLVEGPLTQPQANYISDSGRLFFDSQDSLSPFDGNEGVEDVYEYQPDGVGSCRRSDGCVSLISAGTGPVDSNFLAADPDGENVFFTTRARLVPRDTDELIDLYDARVDGGIPADNPVPPPACQGEGCQQAAPPPPPPPPASAGLSDAGNVKPAGKPCRKPKVRRNGRCVKKKQAKHRRKQQGRPHRIKRGGLR